MGDWWGWGAKADVSIAEELRLHSNSRRDPSAQYLLRRNLHNCAIVKYQNVLSVCFNRMYKVFSFESKTVCVKLFVCPLQVQSCSSKLQAKHRLPVLSGFTHLDLVCCLVLGLGVYSVGQVFVFVLYHIAGFPCQS